MWDVGKAVWSECNSGCENGLQKKEHERVYNSSKMIEEKNV